MGIQDIFSQIGGVVANINIGIGTLATATVSTYLVSLASMMKRKAKHQINTIILDRNIHYIPKIIQIIDSK